MTHCLSCRFAVWLLGLFAVLGSGDATAQVVINEVMFDPAVNEFTDEYIELYNAGDAVVDLNGWRIGDDGELDAIVSLGGGTLLAPGAYALVLDANYSEGTQPYAPLPEALMLTVDGATLGNSGLSNARSERILLVSAPGDTVGKMRYEPGNVPGLSEEKIDPVGGDGAENWVDARWPTPGRINSVSRKIYDAALRAVPSSPLYLPWGQSGAFELDVVNVGRDGAAGLALDVLNETGQVQSLNMGVIASGDSVRISVPAAAPPGGQMVFEASIQWAADQDTTNNRATWRVVGGVPAGAVVINEAMPMPDQGAGEWVELLNLLSDPVDLTGWTLADVSVSGRVGAGQNIPPGGYAILAERADAFRGDYGDISVPVLPLSRWPRLNDGGDVLVLKDPTGTVVDSVACPAAARGISLERIDASASGLAAQNWLGSTQKDGATPGEKNAVGAVDVDGVQLVAEPNPFVTQTVVTYELPVLRAHVNLQIFDRRGRRVCTLLDAAEGGGRRQVTWRGQGDGGQMLKPGIYMLVLEARGAAGAPMRKKVPVVLIRGL